MFFDRDNVFGSALEIGLIIGSFFAGKKVGHYQAFNDLQNLQNQREIEDLRQQVSDLKQLSINLMKNQPK